MALDIEGAAVGKGKDFELALGKMGKLSLPRLNLGSLSLQAEAKEGILRVLERRRIVESPRARGVGGPMPGVSGTGLIGALGGVAVGGDMQAGPCCVRCVRGRSALQTFARAGCGASMSV